MKILHIITSLRTGGAEKLMVDLLPRLRDLGNDVELLIFDGTRTPFYDEIERSGITIHSFSIGGNVYSIQNLFHLIKFMKRYDIIHTHNTICQLYAAIANIFNKDTILVTTEHNSTNRRRENKVFYFGDMWMYHQYKRIICIANQTKQNLENYIGKNDKITTIYNGIDTQYFSSVKSTRKPDSNIIITMVARFSEQKDQDTLIRSMKLLPSNYQLQLVGDGPRRNILQNLVSQEDLSTRVQFLGIRSDIPQILANSDIVVLSSHWEGLSLSSIEGMSSGKPFVASDVDGLHEIVNGNGVLFPQGDYNTLAKTLLKLGTDKEYATNISKRCQQKAFQYDISIMAKEYNSLYHNIIK